MKVRKRVHLPDSAYDVDSRLPETVEILGNEGLIGAHGIGVCGSRDVDASGLELAVTIGALAASMDLSVVSGNARGIDDMAHQGVLEAGGSTIYALPEGLEKWKPRKSHRPLLTESNHLAVSMFEAEATWQSWRAMQRNALIVALSDALFVVGAREHGGTRDAALRCLDARRPLFVIGWASDGHGREGNRSLIERGGVAIRTQGELKGALRSVQAGEITRGGQQVLF